MFCEEVSGDMGLVMDDADGKITLASVDKNGAHEITMSLDEWGIFQTQLTAVKQYLTAADMKLKEWKNSSAKAKEEFKPLMCEQVKINDMVALFLSMYQGKDSYKDFWFVRVSLRAYFTKDNQMIPKKKPAITFKPGDIDKLIQINGSLYLYLKSLKEKHDHPEIDSCPICRFMDTGIIVHHLINANNDETVILDQVKTCVRDFQHLNHPGQCLITLYQNSTLPSEDDGPKKKKVKFADDDDSPLKSALAEIIRKNTEEIKSKDLPFYAKEFEHK